MLGTYPLSTLPLSTLEAVAPSVVPASPVGGGGWYAPRREPPRPRKPERRPVQYIVTIGGDVAAVIERGVSYSLRLASSVGRSGVDTVSRAVTANIYRTASVNASAIEFNAWQITSEVVRDIAPERPADIALATRLASRISPFDVDSIILAHRRELRRLGDRLMNGQINAAEWRRAALNISRAAHIAASSLGRGRQMRSGDWLRVDAEIRSTQTQIDSIAKLARIGCSVSVESRSRRLAEVIRTSYDAVRLAIKAETAQ